MTAAQPDLGHLDQLGVGLVIGAVEPDGAPYVARAWALRVLDHQERWVRMVVPGDDDRLAACLRPGSLVAVTGAEVATLRAIQAKGVVTSYGEATEDDLALEANRCGAFFDAIAAVDAIPRALLDRILPGSFASCEFLISSLFDQTPGPRAGVALGGQ